VTPEDLPAGHDGRVNQGLAMTDYLREQVMCKRPYIKLEWCREALDRPVRREVQPEDGRIRHWIFVPELNRYLRVVTLPDGATIHNAFPDRRFKP
jgi:hypothetical protein